MRILRRLRTEHPVGHPAPTGKPGAQSGQPSTSRWRALLPLVILYLVLAASVLLFAGYSYTQFEAEYRSEVERQLSAIADLKVRDLSDWRQERIEDGSLLFRNPVLTRLVEQATVASTDPGASAELAEWLSVYKDHFQYSQAILLDVDGVIVFADPPLAQTELGGHLAIDSAAAHSLRKVILLDFHQDVPDGPVFLSVLIPFRNSRDKPLGTVVLRINPDVNLYPFLQRWPVPSDSGETLLVRRDGWDVLYLNDLRFREQAALSMRLSLSNADLPAAAAIFGQEGIFEGRDYRGVDVISELRSVPDSSWFLVAKLDRTEAYAPVRDRLVQTILLSLAVLATLALTVSILWRRQQIRFYRERYQAAEALRVLSARQEALLDSVPDIIMEVNAQKVYTWANRPGLVFFGEDVIGREAADYFLGEQETYTIVEPLFGGREEIVYVESWQRRQDGERRLLAWWCRVLKDKDGRVIGALSTARDITEQQLAEEALRLAYARLERMTSSNVVGVVIADPHGGLLEANDYYLNLLGYSREEFRAGGVRWDDCTPPEHRLADQRAIAELRETGVCTPYEKEYIRKDGARVWVYLADAMIPGPEEKILAIVIDITPQKLTEEALRISEMHFRNIFDNSPAGIALVGLDGKYRMLNPAYCSIFGYSEEAMLATQFLSLTHPDDVERSRQLQKEVLAGKGKQIRFTKRYIHKDGHTIWADTGAALICDTEGNPMYFLTNLLDITEQKRTEDALRDSEDKFHYVFEYSAAGKSITELSGIMHVNRTFCEMLGYSREELANRAWQEITHPDDIALCQAEIDTLINGRKTNTRYVKRYLRKDHAILWADISTALRRDAAGRPLYLMTTIVDITERVRAEEEVRRLNDALELRVLERTAQLEAANRELEAFSYSVSHDLRAPLRGISGWSTALQEDYGAQLDDQAREYLDRVLRDTRMMEALIDDLLQLSRVARSSMDRSDVDLSAMAFSIASRLKEQHPDRTIRIDIQPGLTASCDIHLMQIVLTNLLDNAMKFTGPHGKARVEFGQAGPDHESAFFVRDNGVGFDMAYADKLFGAFQRLHKASEFPGTGVGLATVQRIIHRHGGNIWADSKPDAGTTFFFTLGEKPRPSTPED